MSGALRSLQRGTRRRRRLRSLLAIVCIAAGTSMALSVLVVSSSVSRSLGQAERQLLGPAPLEVVGPTTAGLPDSRLGMVAGTPGVRTAVPLVEAASVVHLRSRANVPALVVGAGCAAVALVGGGPCALSTTTALVAPGLRRLLGSQSWLQTDTGVLPLGHVDSVPVLGRIGGVHLVVLPLARAQQLYARVGRIDAIAVLPKRGVAIAGLRRRLSAKLGASDAVLSAGHPPAAVGLATGSVLPLLTLLAVLSAGIATVLVANVVTLSLYERRHHQAVAAALGAPPGLVVAGPLLQVSALGAAGGLGGALAGTALATGVVTSISAFTRSFTGVKVTVALYPSTILEGIAFGLAVALLAAAVPLARASRTPIAPELAGRTLRHRSSARVTFAVALVATGVAAVAVAGVAAGTAGGAIRPWQPELALGSFACFSAAAVVAAGAWAPLVARAARRALPERFGASRLAFANLALEPRRCGIVAAAVAAAVAVAAVTASYQLSVLRAIVASPGGPAPPPTVQVTTVAGRSGFDPDAAVPSSALGALGRLPGVRTVSEDRSVLVGTRAADLLLVQAASGITGGPRLLAGSAHARAFARGQAMVGPAVARRFGVRPGSYLDLPTPHGMVAVRVQGIWDATSLGGATVTLPTAEVTALYGNRPPLSATLRLAKGTNPTAVVAEARRLALPPDLVLAIPRRQVAIQLSQLEAQMAPFRSLQRALLLVAFVSVLSTFALATAQRRRELAVVRAIGSTPSATLRLLVGEAAAVGAIGAALGTACAEPLFHVLLQVAPLVSGFSGPGSLDASATAASVPVAVAVAAVGALAPALRAVRLPVVAALTRE